MLRYCFVMGGPTMNSIVRIATIDDVVPLAELCARSFYDTYAAENTPENMKAYMTAAFGVEQQSAELADPACIFLMAELEGVAAGYAKMQMGNAPDCVTGANPIELARIYADKAWIGKGVGSALMQACLDESHQQGYETIWLGVWERNLRGQAFYHKWGFVQVGTQVFQLGDDVQNDFVLARSVDHR